MRMNVEFNGTLISMKETEGKNGKYYNVSVDCEGEAGTLGCTEDVYQQYVHGDIDRFTDYHFVGQYNSQYGSLRVVFVAAIPQK